MHFNSSKAVDACYYDSVLQSIIDRMELIKNNENFFVIEGEVYIINTTFGN